MGKKEYKTDAEVVADFGITHDALLSDYAALATKPPPDGKGYKPASPKSARELCRIAAAFIESGIPLPDPVQAYLGAALRAASEGKNMDVALGLSYGPRIDALEKRERDYLNCLRVDALIAKGMSKTAAIEQVAEKHLSSDEKKKRGTKVAKNLADIYGHYEKRKTVSD